MPVTHNSTLSPAPSPVDEPSAGLDPRARRALIQLLAALPYTILVSSHDMATVYELFPRMIVTDCGQIVANGPTSKVMGNRAWLESHGLEQPFAMT